MHCSRSAPCTPCKDNEAKRSLPPDRPWLPPPGRTSVPVFVVRPRPCSRWSTKDRASALTKLDEAASVQALWRWGEPWFLGLRLLLRTAAGDDNNRLQPTLATCAPMIQAYGWYTEAIRCGRAGDGLGPPTTLPAHHPARTASPHAAAEKSLERWGQIKPSPRGHFGLTQPAHSGCRSRTASR